MVRFSISTTFQGHAVVWVCGVAALGCTGSEAAVADEVARAEGRVVRVGPHGEAVPGAPRPDVSSPTIATTAEQSHYAERGEASVLASAVAEAGSLSCMTAVDCAAGQFCRWPQGARRMARSRQASAVRRSKVPVGRCEPYRIEAEACDPDLVDADPPQQRCSPELVCGAAVAGFSCRRPCDVDGDCYDTEHCDAEFLCRLGPRPEDDGAGSSAASARGPLLVASENGPVSGSRGKAF